ncbi:MAG: hypothetical protein KGQ49_07120 [Verrucomicrobia bacterium]|nr:hypothetical protein [Verrucomicrobiota bacterium]
MEGADAKKHARLAINWAWAHYILEEGMGNEGKPYLAKITDPAIQDTARGYIDHVIRREVDSLGHQRKFEEATQRVSDIHSTAVQAEAIGSIAEHRLAYDQELLQEIQTTLGKRNYHEPTNKCTPQICSWPKDYEAHVDSTLAKITDADTKLKAQRAIGEAWVQYILDRNLERDKALANIADPSIRTIARKGLEKMVLETVKTLIQEKKFDEAGKVVSQIQTPSIRKQAEDSLDAGLLKRIKHILTKTKSNPQYDASKNADCRGCYWPEDFEQAIEKLISQISNTDVQAQARKSIAQAWAQHIHK